MPLPSSVAKYEIERPLKQGGMGALYLGFDPELERQVAIKVLRDDLKGEEPRARFVREARAAAGLRHPNIVTIYDFGLDGGHPYIAMEYIPGHSLAEIIAQRVPLSIPRRLGIVEDLCTAVGYAHRRQIVHRDIKPGNVMLDADGSVKVLDFGLARTADSALTREGIVMGTLNYMSPEQLSGDAMDHRSDIFAVGAVLYELLAFRQAFGGGVSDGVIVKILQREPDPLPPLAGDVDADVAAVVGRALRKDPSGRYPDLFAMRADLVAVRTRLERAETQPIARAALVVDAVARPDGPGGAPSSAQAVALLEVAREALSTGEFERALAACNAAVAIDPEAAPTARTLKLHAEQQRASAARVERDRSVRPGAPDGTPSGRARSSRPVMAGVLSVGLRAATRTHLLAGTVLIVAMAAGLWAFRAWMSVHSSHPTVTAPVAPTANGASRSAIAQAAGSNSNGPSHLPQSNRDVARPRKADGPAISSPRHATGAERPQTDPTRSASETRHQAGMPALAQEIHMPEVDVAGVAVDAAPMRAPQTSPTRASDSPLVGRALGADRAAALVTGPASAAGIPEARTPADSDAQLIGQTLQRYAAAMSARDLEALETVLTMDASARRRQAELFERYVSASVRVRPAGPPSIVGASARVRCTVDEAIEIRGRPRSTGTSVLDVKLRKTGAQWRIVEFVDR